MSVGDVHLPGTVAGLTGAHGVLGVAREHGRCLARAVEVHAQVNVKITAEVVVQGNDHSPMTGPLAMSLVVHIHRVVAEPRVKLRTHRSMFVHNISIVR